MDSREWKLDFNMQILLAHAMKSEAGLIRQHYPQAKTIIRKNGQEMIRLDKKLHILRTGIGLEQSKIAMLAHVKPDQFDLIIHFGVSGSLTDNLKVSDVIRGNQFSRAGKSVITLNPPAFFADLSVPEAAFFSTLTAITDESSRDLARANGAEVVDMESYSIATFCQAWDIPLLAIRCISDRAGASTPEDFKEHYSVASETLQKFLLQNILNHLP